MGDVRRADPLARARDLAPAIAAATDEAERLRRLPKALSSGCTRGGSFACGIRSIGGDTIFPGSPFERRFRDIHAVSLQIQSRDAHYETVGQVLFGNPPEVFV